MASRFFLETLGSSEYKGILMKTTSISLTIVIISSMFLSFASSFVLAGQKEAPSVDFQSILGVKLRSSFNDIPKTLGQAPVIRSSRTGDSDALSACYVSSQPADGTMLIFFGDPEDGISSFSVLSSTAASKEKTRICTLSSQVSKEIHIPNHLRLGMDRQSLLNLLGKPKWNKDEFMEWEIVGRQKSSQAEDQQKGKKDIDAATYDFDYKVLVTIRNGKVASFSVEDKRPLYD